MEQILAELRALREIVQSLQPREVPLALCGGVTGKGTPCRNRSVSGSGYCRMHGERPPKAERPPRVPKKPKKPKKIQPEHAHGIGEPRGACPLCDTHGDVWDPALPECRFVCVD